MKRLKKRKKQKVALAEHGRETDVIPPEAKKRLQKKQPPKADVMPVLQKNLRANVRLQQQKAKLVAVLQKAVKQNLPGVNPGVPVEDSFYWIPITIRSVLFLQDGFFLLMRSDPS